MSVNGKPTIDRIDHGVVPSNDLGRAHRFYGGFMGGEIDHLTNLTIRGLNREVPQIVFYTLANHKGWGVALQDFPISPNPARPLEGVVYGFEVAADNPDDVVNGKVFRITEAELKAADEYEVSDYKRIHVQLRSGNAAWVYVRA